MASECSFVGSLDLMCVALLAETDEFLMEMDEDVEGLQTTILVLQQQLKEAKDQISHLEDVNSKLQSMALPQTTTAYSNQTTDCGATVDTSIVKKEKDRSNTSTPTGQLVDSSSINSSISGERTTTTTTAMMTTTTTTTQSRNNYNEASETPSTTATSNGQHEEAMDTVDNITGQQQAQQDSQMLVTNKHHHHNHRNLPHSLENTDGKAPKESPLSPGLRTGLLPPRDTLQGAQVWTDGKFVGGGSGTSQTDEPIQNGLISSQYDSQSDES